MPRCIVQHQNNAAVFITVAGRLKLSDALYRCLVIEPNRFCNEQCSFRRREKTAVGDGGTPRVGFHFRTASFGKPLSGDGGFHGEMHFVLKTDFCVRIFRQIFQFFLNSSLAGAFSSFFDGNFCGRIRENPSS